MLRKISKEKSVDKNTSNNHEEEQYLNLIRDILSEGTIEQSAYLVQLCIFLWTMA
jgi:hypothetical protein